MRQLTTQLDQSNVSLTSMSSQKSHSENLLKQANEEINELNRRLDENEQIKMNLFRKVELKDREIQNLRSLLRRTRMLLEANTRGGNFEDADALEVDRALADLDSVKLDFELPESRFDHLYTASRNQTTETAF